MRIKQLIPTISHSGSHDLIGGSHGSTGPDRRLGLGWFQFPLQLTVFSTRTRSCTTPDDALVDAMGPDFDKQIRSAQHTIRHMSYTPLIQRASNMPASQVQPTSRSGNFSNIELIRVILQHHPLHLVAYHADKRAVRHRYLGTGTWAEHEHRSRYGAA